MIFDKDYGRIFRLILSSIVSLIVTIAVMINSGYLQFLDTLVIDNLQSHKSTFDVILYKFISFMGSPKMSLFIGFIIAFLFWGFKFKIQSLWILGTMFFGNIIITVIKEIVRRPRPLMHSIHDSGFSYPSGHSFNTFLIIAILWLFVFPMLKKQRLRLTLQFFGIIIVILQMMSRVYLNAHYPSDTIGAILIAYTWVQGIQILYYRLAPRLLNWRFTHNSYI